MKALILSDIHANLEALDAVLIEAPREDYDRLLVLGDLIGYGANPNEVVDRIFELAPDVLIRGNHDKVGSGLEDPHHFNDVAAAAAVWTLEALTDDNRARVAELPRGPALVDEDIEICHGTPFDEDTYVFDQSDASRAFSAAKRRVCFFLVTRTYRSPSNCARRPLSRSSSPNWVTPHRPSSPLTASGGISSTLVQSVSHATATRGLPTGSSTPKAMRLSCVACPIASTLLRRRLWRPGCRRPWPGGSG